MSSRVIPLVWLLLIALLAQPALAQMLYKSTMPDGRVVYGDQPARGAVKVEATKPDTSSKGIVPSTPKEATAVKQMENQRSAREEGEERVRAAELALRNAEAMRAAGQEPTAGERIGTAGGASRLTDDYWRRQKSLDDIVEQARQDLENARAGK